MIKWLGNKFGKQQEEHTYIYDDYKLIFGEKSNFGDLIFNHHKLIFDSRYGVISNDYNKNTENTVGPDGFQLDNKLFRMCGNNFILGRYLIESIQKSPLHEYMIFDMKGKISESLAKTLAVYIPILLPSNLNYFTHINFASFFKNLLRYLPEAKLTNIANSMLDISFTQMKSTHLTFQFLNKIEEHKKAMKSTRKLFSTFHIFEGLVMSEYSAMLLKSSVEKILDLVSIIAGCEKRVANAKKTQGKINCIADHVKNLGLSNNHWSALQHHFSSDSLSDLNNFRTAVLHTRGLKSLDFTKATETEQALGALEMEKLLKRYSFIIHIGFLFALMILVDFLILKVINPKAPALSR